MLYDPKWERKETKADPEYEGVRLSEFIAWLETKPADERYRYTRPDQCAVAQFLQSKGLSESESKVSIPRSDPWAEAHWLDQIVCFTGSEATFGAALQRAKAYAASL